MKWLVVIDSDLVSSVLQMLKQVSAQVLPFSDPVPLSDGETSIEVEGPDDLPNRLERNSAVKGVYPSSDYTLF